MKRVVNFEGNEYVLGWVEGLAEKAGITESEEIINLLLEHYKLTHQPPLPVGAYYLTVRNVPTVLPGEPYEPFRDMVAIIRAIRVATNMSLKEAHNIYQVLRDGYKSEILLLANLSVSEAEALRAKITATAPTAIPYLEFVKGDVLCQ
jgi:hypothetical protein